MFNFGDSRILDRKTLFLRVAPMALLAITAASPAPASAPPGAHAIQARPEQTKTEGAGKDEKETSDVKQAEAPKVKTLRAGGSRLDWCDKSDLIAFDVRGKNKYFEVHTMKSDGSADTCVSCDVPGLPQRHVGQPAWHPSCRYLVVQAEKQEHVKVRFTHSLTPGAGVLNDLWLIDLEKKTSHPIRELPNDRDHGTLHPHFSPDGSRLSWSEMVAKAGMKKKKEVGYWKLMTADFEVEGGKPRLSNVRAFAPGGDAFYENHGFSPDSKKLIFSSNFDGKRFINNIYVMDLASERAVRLTEDGYNEHASFTPDGKRIVWISNVGNPNRGTDYWIMNSDGSAKQRLTFFNQKGHPQYAGRRVVVADFSWSPDGKTIAAYYRAGDGLESESDEVKIVTMDVPEGPRD
jgi:hypothetical protein